MSLSQIVLSSTHKDLQQQITDQLADSQIITEIKQIVKRDPVDIVKLRQIAKENGLATNRVRKKVWPKLLAINPHSVNPSNYRAQAVLGHSDTNTVAVDVERSAWLAGKVVDAGNAAQSILINLRRSLQRLINGVVCSHPQDVYYYQGFHDVAAVCLLVLGEDTAYPVLEVLAMHHLRDCSRPTLSLVMSHLSLFFPLLQEEHPEIHDFLKLKQKEAELEEDGADTFAVPWVLTWFSHAMTDLQAAARLFDLFIVSDPLMPVYVGVVFLGHFQSDIMRHTGDYADLRKKLLDLPNVNSTTIRGIVTKALNLHERIPPPQLQQIAGVQLPLDSAMYTYPYTWMDFPVRRDSILRKIAHALTRYEGEEKHGKMEGWGTYTYPNSNTYNGQFKLNRRHGLGRFTWARTNEKYEGEWLNDKRHGYGSHLWHDGTKFDGEFRYDRLDGDGVYSWPDGRRFEGRFRADKQDGFGIYIDSDGNQCGGHWLDGGLTRFVDLDLCGGSVKAADHARTKAQDAVRKLCNSAFMTYDAGDVQQYGLKPKKEKSKKKGFLGFFSSA